MFLLWEGTQTNSYIFHLLGLDLYSVIKRGGGMIWYYTCYFDPLRSPGKPPFWWTSSITKTRQVPTKVTMVGSSIVMQDLGTYSGALHKYKSCDNTPYKPITLFFSPRKHQDTWKLYIDPFEIL
jgi:hypothetical protein